MQILAASNLLLCIIPGNQKPKLRECLQESFILAQTVAPHDEMQSDRLPVVEEQSPPSHPPLPARRQLQLPSCLLVKIYKVPFGHSAHRFATGFFYSTDTPRGSGAIP